MKVNVLAAAVLATFAGAALAQSSVQITGRADAAIGKPIGSEDKRVGQGKGSLLFVKGQEDLGGGNVAFFDLQSDIFLDTGTALSGNGVSGSAGFWQARSLVGLKNKNWSVDMGRKLTPAWVVAINADPWGTYSYVTVNTTGLFAGGLFSSARNQKAASINWTGDDGFFASAQIAEADKTKVWTRGGTTPVPNFASIVASGSRPVSLAAGYNKGNIYAGIGYEATGYNTKAIFLTGTYNFGPAKLWLHYGNGRHEEVVSGNTDLRANNFLVGLTAPLGVGEVRSSFDFLKTEVRGSDGSFSTLQASVNGRFVDAYPNNSRKFGLGYFYPLSKRTELFINATHDSKAYMEKTGYDMGMTHHF